MPSAMLGVMGSQGVLDHRVPPPPCTFLRASRCLPLRVHYRVGFNKEGKCTYFKFYNSGAFMYQDSLVSENESVVAQMIPLPERPVADKDFAKNLETFWGNMQAWGSGVYNGPKDAALETLRSSGRRTASWTSVTP